MAKAFASSCNFKTLIEYVALINTTIITLFLSLISSVQAEYRASVAFTGFPIRSSSISNWIDFLSTTSSTNSALSQGLKVFNDGPAVLDSVLTFVAELENNTGTSDKYQYVFQHNANCYGEHRYSIESGRNASLRLVFSNTDCREGTYVMNVSVYEKVLFVFDKKIAFGSTTFLLTKLLNGNISVSQDEESEEQSDLTLLSTKEETNLTVTLHDPSSFLDNSTITYSWNIDKLVFIDAGPSLTYNFSRPGKYNIGVTVVAFFVPIASQFQKNNTGTDMTKWGRFSRQVTAKDPIESVNVTGNLYFEHGDMLNLKVSCSGSGPYEYCWKIFDTGERPVNVTCPEPVVTSNCSFLIVHYFSNPGSYHIGMFIANDITHLQRGLDVHIYDVSRKKPLSVVIVPVSCSVVAIIIIVVGVTYHLQQRKKQKIEVADFDFQTSDELVEKTFFERLRDSFKDVLRNVRHSEQTPQMSTSVNGHVKIKDAAVVDSSSFDGHSSYGAIA